MNNDIVEKFIHLKTIESTNTYAKELTDLPRKGISIVIADRQTGGRGQRGNTFFSDHHGGIWCTIIQPMTDISDHFIFNRALAVSLAETLAPLAPRGAIAIKWPNDIYWNGRKICGMLLESHPASARHMVIGFGLNVNIEPEEFPGELRTIATSILAETRTKTEQGPLLEQIVGAYDRLSRLPVNSAHEQYCELLYGRGNNVEVMGETGIFNGVMPDGRAEVSVGGEHKFFSSGPMRFFE
jgi:BirA family transcriptional regulator, biotin operon repressor / biotin---[acetyl-CoA-carboxylase] ligase